MSAACRFNGRREIFGCKSLFGHKTCVTPTQIGHLLIGQFIRASRYSYCTGIGKLEEDLSSEVPYSAVNSTGDQPLLLLFG